MIPIGMIIHPAVIVHGLADVRDALAVGAPVTLLSASGAARYAGCLWWREVVRSGCAGFPDTPFIDILDCADASGMAMSALRSDVIRLVLWPRAPGWQGVARIAQDRGGFVLPVAPVALDMAERGAQRRLHQWLKGSGP
jgi:hypothetical protein